MLAELETGTLEALLMTPTRLSTVMSLSSFWTFMRTSLRVVLYLAIGAFVLDVNLSRANFPGACLVIGLTITALAGYGIFSAGCVLIFKKMNPINFLVNGASNFLAGVYFPVGVLPLWLQKFSLLVPLTYFPWRGCARRS
ncbi:MAG: ABC transporter permease [Acidobacteria bacterium]|nr:ABC transporter permease [Acidobacteriota bacterium]